MSPYLRVARVLFVLALLLIGLLIALPMELLSEHYRKLTLAFATGLFLAAAISFCMHFGPFLQSKDEERKE